MIERAFVFVLGFASSKDYPHRWSQSGTKLKCEIQGGSEKLTSLVFEWSKPVQTLDGQFSRHGLNVPNF